ncbi:Sec-independent protein translocase protein TatB [Dongia soli]|uniref:Sec-independent protein translocase protein TatB n=1 Tax=Dongia soli TaxID=600628 RepID=A0ABU5EFV6_9PROT|nr:Sec-independent protein translocase protein TatB [Dongia soli]MDY0885101.1 Sec-independent protein translocase protein TatB [Dongia soli]
MFDLGWDEMAVIAVVALVVLGPKELPNALRTVSGLMKQARKLANEFQSGVHEIIREAELEDAKKAVQGLSKGTIVNAIEKHVDPDGDLKTAFKAPQDDVDQAKIADQPKLADQSDASGEAKAAITEVKTEVNPAVAAFGPNGTAHRLPDNDDAEENRIAAINPEETPVETIGAEHAPIAPAKVADASTDMEKSKTS